MMLVGAALMIQSVMRLQRVDTGFRGSSVLTVDRIELPRRRSSPEVSAAFFEALDARLLEIPGVESAGVTLGLPLDPRARFFVDDSPFSIVGAPLLPQAQRPAAPIHVVSPEYFTTIGVPLRRGRSFTDRDRAGAPGVVMINEAMARRFWPGESPVGRRITHDLSIVPDQPTTREIVGIVGDVRHFGLEQAAEPQMFVPHAQMPWPSMAVVVRSRLDASRLSAAVRQAVWSIDNTIPVPPVRSMDATIGDAVGQPRFRAWLLGLFAATAVLLATTGLYSTMAYAAQRRTQEIGVRIALGATPRQATAMLVRQHGDRLRRDCRRPRGIIGHGAGALDDAVRRRRERSDDVGRRGGGVRAGRSGRLHCARAPRAAALPDRGDQRRRVRPPHRWPPVTERISTSSSGRCRDGRAPRWPSLRGGGVRARAAPPPSPPAAV
jgi:putative ABC transport system permease protein